MSSIIGHLATGLTAALACQPSRHPHARAVWPVFVLLAVCPDFDYFAVWLFGYSADPRFSHSLVFACATAWSAHYMLRRRATPVPFAALLAASLSHPILDLMVGAHPLPLLWPFAEAEVSTPLGVLPSAGRLDPSNYFLWRNLLIELGVLIPVLALVIALARRLRPRVIALASVFFAPWWTVFVAWSLSLHR